MLGVILTILKILLWIVLAIILLVLLLVLLILFMPIRYRVEGAFYDDYDAKVKVGYLGARVRANFSKEEGLFYKVRFLGIPILSSKKKEKDEQETEARKKKPKDKTDKKKEKPDKKPDKKIDIESDKKTDTKVETQQNVANPTKSDKSKIESITVTDQDLLDFEQQTVAEKPPSVVERLTELKETVTTKKNHVQSFLEKDFTKRTIQRGKKLLLRILKTILPKKAKGNLTLGLSNPADTGVAAGAISVLLPLYNGWFHIEPDFHHQVVEGDLWFKGKIRLAVIVFPALRIILSRDLRRTLALAKKI